MGLEGLPGELAIPSFNDLAKFKDSALCFVYARDKRDPSAQPYYLKNGDAPRMKERAIQELECIMPVCADREITTVSKVAGRRDGFRHNGKNAKGHGDEFEVAFAVQAKALVERWIRAKYPEVSIDSRPYEIDDVDGRAHIRLSWKAGERLAIEIAYSSMTFSEWEEQTNNLLEEGTQCIWIFGHLQPHFPDWLSQSKKVRLPILQEKILATGNGLLWINPIEEEIATILTQTEVPGCKDLECNGRGVDCMQSFVIEYLGKEKSSFLHLDSFLESTLTPYGVLPASLQYVATSLDTYRTALDNNAERNRVRNEKIATYNARADHEIGSLETGSIGFTIPKTMEEANAQIEARRAAYWAKYRFDKIAKGEWTEDGKSIDRYPLEDPSSRTGYSCTVCGTVLAKDFKAVGRHGMC